MRGTSRIVALLASAWAATALLSRADDDNGHPRRDTAAYPAAPLECFDVTHPVLTPNGLAVGNQKLGGQHHGQGEKKPSCTVTLMDHVFANSYGHPFVADYAPPSPSSCSGALNFSRVVMNLTVVSEGRQYDRLALMWLGDTEVWRTSTAEPKRHPGIAWTYWKDMSNYLSLWRQPQTLIFDLGNLVNSVYTGSFNATLTATYFTANGPAGPAAAPADQILPISAGRADDRQGSAWTYPEQKAEAWLRLPADVKRAVVSVAATGQADEEFWWSNVPEGGVDTFNGTQLLGKGAFREVRLSIDGQIAGLSWPFPVVFTGGVSPPLHRPVVGPQAFDLREQEMDISPWLGVLCDGEEHVFGLQVFGADDAVVNNNWLLSAKLFIWRDVLGRAARGSAPTVTLSKPNYQAYEVVVPNRDLRYDQTITRSLDIRGEISRGHEVVRPSWSQTFTMRNRGHVLDSGDIQTVTALYDGEDKAEEDTAMAAYSATYSYPISVSFRQTYPDGKDSLALDTNMTQQLDLTVTGQTVFSNGLEPFLGRFKDRMTGSSLSTKKAGRGFFQDSDKNNASFSFGNTHQYYKFGYRTQSDGQGLGVPSTKELYWRDVWVVNETVTRDSYWVDGGTASPTVAAKYAANSVKDVRHNTFAARLIGGRGRQHVDADADAVLSSSYTHNQTDVRNQSPPALHIQQGDVRS